MTEAKKLSTKSKCDHSSDRVSGSWHYVGDKLFDAGGYCRDCRERLYYCEEAKMLVPKDKVRKPLPPKEYKL